MCIAARIDMKENSVDLPEEWKWLNLEYVDKLSFVPLNRETLEAFDQFDMRIEGEYHFYFLRVADSVFTHTTCVQLSLRSLKPFRD